MYDQDNTYIETDDVLLLHRLFADERGRSLATVRQSGKEILYRHDSITEELALGLIRIHLGELPADTTLTSVYPLLYNEMSDWLTQFRDTLEAGATVLEEKGDNPYLTEPEILLLAKWERELKRLAADVTNQVGLDPH